VTYKGFRNLELRLGARNLLDANPPLSNQNVTFQPGYDPTYYDARARMVYLNATYSFR
jgi:iron complex outermembrane receptor protein